MTVMIKFQYKAHSLRSDCSELGIFIMDDFKSIIEPTHELSVVDEMRFVLSDITGRYLACQAGSGCQPSIATLDPVQP